MEANYLKQEHLLDDWNPNWDQLVGAAGVGRFTCVQPCAPAPLRRASLAAFLDFLRFLLVPTNLSRWMKTGEQFLCKLPQRKPRSAVLAVRRRYQSGFRGCRTPRGRAQGVWGDDNAAGEAVRTNSGEALGTVLCML